MVEHDLNAMLDELPDYVVFHGAADWTHRLSSPIGAIAGDNAFRASVGEHVRIFLRVGGSNLTSRFHVIVAIVDRVLTEGSLTDPPAPNVQTTRVSACGATMVELTPKEPGTYTMVDHSISRMQKGAAGQPVVDGPANPEIFQSIAPGSGGTGAY